MIYYPYNKYIYEKYVIMHQNHENIMILNSFSVCDHEIYVD